MESTEHQQKKSKRKTRPNSPDWPDERPPLDEFLKSQERRIRRIAYKATLNCPEYLEDMAQDLRMRVMRAWETWDKDKGPLSAHSWRHIMGGHLRLRRRSWTAPLGYRSSADMDDAPKIHSIDAPLDDDRSYADVIAGDNTRDFELAEANAEAALLVERLHHILTRDGKGRIQHINFHQILDRLACVEPGDMVEVAERQGVSVQAIASSRNRAMATIRAAMEELRD